MANQPEKSKAEKAYSELEPYEQMMRELGGIAQLNAGDNFDIAAGVINKIAVATSADQIFAANESGPGDASDYLGKPLGIYAVRYQKSAEQYASGTLGVYAVFDALTDDGEKVMISVGAPNVVASIRQMEVLGLFDESRPFRFVIRGRTTANGTLYTVHAA